MIYAVHSERRGILNSPFEGKKETGKSIEEPHIL